MNRRLLRWVAAGFGAGWSPLAPGTVGTLAAIPFAWLWSQLPGAVHLALLLGLLPVGAAVCGAAAGGERHADPSWVVLDEMLGFWVAVALLPASPATYLAGFFLFRLFDILKPPPVGWVDRHVGGGWGILLDDVVAGLMARLGLEGLRAVAPW